MVKNYVSGRVAKLRPYANEKQFVEAALKHGLFIKTDNILRLPLSIVYNEKTDLEYSDRIGVAYSVHLDNMDCTIPFNQLIYDEYSWLDGTPCGIVDE